MRPLTPFLLLVAVALPTLTALPAWALQQSVMSSYTLTEVSGSPSAGSGISAAPIGTTTETLSYRLDGIQKYFNYAGGFSIRQPDYSGFIVRNRQGEQRTLKELGTTANEISTDQALEAVIGSNRMTVGWSGLVSDSPLGFQSFNTTYQHGFFENSTLIGLQATYLLQKQPETFYIDRDFKNRSRPTLIHGNEVILTLDQILAERWKLSLDLSTAERLEERPRNFGIMLGQSYALSERVSLQARGRRIVEPHGAPLKNERGTFAMTQAELGVTYEPLYDLLVSTSYGLGVETELDPVTGVQAITASDQYGLGIKYAFHEYEIQAQGSLNLGNTSYRSSSLTGGFTWKL